MSAVGENKPSAMEEKFSGVPNGHEDSETTLARKISHTQQEWDSGHERESSGSTYNGSDRQEETSSSDDDNNQHDCFVDASEDLHELGEGSPYAATLNQAATEATGAGDVDRADLKVRLDEAARILRLALSNEFIKGLEQCEERAKSELYASLGHATLSFLRATLTLERTDLEHALASINQAFEVSRSQRRQVSTASMVMRFLYKPDYDLYTDDEIHAELVHAESMLLLSLISFLADQSVLCLVRGALRIRACYQRYKECLYILENRREWSSHEAQIHFESGVRMGHGVFNLLMSYLPRRVLKILEYVGFSGSRTVGVDELDKSIELNDGLRSVLSALVILMYHSYVENIFGLGHYDDAKVKQINNTFLGHYPDSAFFLLFLGRYHQMQGRLDEAIRSFERCCEVQQDWKQFHSLCHWEIMWCHACRMDWKQAAHFADLLRQNSKWSPSSYQYQYGTFLYAQLIHEQRQGLISEDSEEFISRMEEVLMIIGKVPSLRIRFAGKTIPADKFAITRAIKLCENNEPLSLPSLEFLYIWNVFSTLRNNPQQVEKHLSCINSEIEHIKKSMETSQDASGGENSHIKLEGESGRAKHKMTCIDNLCLMYLLKGVSLKLLNRYEEAENIFTSVIEYEDQIVVDKFLVPHSAMELALLNLQLKHYDAAKKWIKMARHNYTGYLMETIVHFRLHAASRIIRIEQQHQQEREQKSSLLEDSFDQSPCPSPDQVSIGRRHSGQM